MEDVMTTSMSRALIDRRSAGLCRVKYVVQLQLTRPKPLEWLK